MRHDGTLEAESKLDKSLSLDKVYFDQFQGLFA